MDGTPPTDGTGSGSLPRSARSAKDTGQRMVFPGPLGNNACWNQDHDGHLSDGEPPDVQDLSGTDCSSDQPGFCDLLGKRLGKDIEPVLHLYPKRDLHHRQNTLRCAAAVRLTVTLRVSKATARIGTATAEEYYPNQALSLRAIDVNRVERRKQPLRRFGIRPRRHVLNRRQPSFSRRSSDSQHTATTNSAAGNLRRRLERQVRFALE